MDLIEFKNLTEEDKITVVVYKATYIGHRVDERNDIVYLYYHEGVFVEVTYLRSKRLPDKIYPFIRRDLLEPYINNIDITDLN